MPRHDGFSLIETLLAVGLLSTALIVLAQLLAGSVQATASVEFHTGAALAAQNAVERLRTQATLAPSAGVEFADETGQAVCGGSVCDAARFRVETSVETFAPLPGLVLIQAEAVDAHRPQGEARAFALRRDTIR